MDFHETVKQLNQFRQHLSRCIREEQHPEWNCPCHLCKAATLATLVSDQLLEEYAERQLLTDAVLDEEYELVEVPAGHEHELGGDGEP